MLNALWALLRVFGGICTFRVAPQDLPRSTTLLAVTTFGNLGLSVVIYWLESPFGRALFKAMLETAVLFGLTYALLFLLSHGRRLTQTMTAMMGCGTLLGVLALVTMLLAPVLPPDLRWALLRINFVLNLLVIAHILRHAIGTWFLVGLLLAFGYALLLTRFFMFADALFGITPA